MSVRLVNSLSLILLASAVGCVNGPVRYKVLGFRRSAMLELTLQFLPGQPLILASALSTPRPISFWRIHSR
jgi:hypothetical protein